MRAIRTQLPLRTWRGSCYGRLLRGLFERSQHDVATRHGRVERLLGSFLAGKCGLDFLGPDVAHLYHVAEAKTARVFGRRLVGKLLERRFRYRILLVEAVRLGFFISGLGDRQVAGFLVPISLAV